MSNKSKTTGRKGGSLALFRLMTEEGEHKNTKNIIHIYRDVLTTQLAFQFQIHNNKCIHIVGDVLIMYTI